MFMLALLIISLAVAVPRVRKEIQRDKDLETYHRGMQYRRAVQLYYKKFRAYPPSIDALVTTNNVRFLRKRYTDPITGKDDWKPIHFGQNKVPMAYGFFGQPLGGDVLAGTGPGGIPGASSNGSAFNAGSSLSGGSSFSSGSSSSSGSSVFGSSSSQTGASSSQTGNASPAGTTGGSDSSSSSSSSPSSNQTFGAGGIIGFEPGSEKQSILVYKKKNHYNEWEFTYSYVSDQAIVSGGNAGTIGQPVSSPGAAPQGSGITQGGPPQQAAPTPQQ